MNTILFFELTPDIMINLIQHVQSIQNRLIVLLYNLGQYSFYFELMHNPFRTSASPISDLYQRARIKSKQNRQRIRSPVQSYREFQVKIIRNALNNNHIIQKQYQGEQKNIIERERRRSKYLGIQSQRYESTDQKNYQEKKRIESNYCSTGKQTCIVKEVHFKKRQSDRLQTMINLQGCSVQNVKSQRMMTYSSNYDMGNELRKSSGQILSTKGRIRVSRELQKQNMKSPQRRCSITDSLQNEGDNHKRGLNQFVSNLRIDRIRQEYFNTQYY